MNTFEDFKIKKQLQNAIADLGFEKPTPIQQASYSTILGGSDFVGIAQTGTGKTMAYVLPISAGLEVFGPTQPEGVNLGANQRVGHSNSRRNREINTLPQRKGAWGLWW